MPFAQKVAVFTDLLGKAPHSVKYLNLSVYIYTLECID